MSPRNWSLAALMMTLLWGQGSFISGSLHADDTGPVATDLVELAITIPEVVAELHVSNERIPRQILLQQKGFLPQGDLDALRKQRTIAIRKLELLRLLIDAELKATSVRLEFLKARQKDMGIDSPIRITAAEERLKVLSLLKEACEVPTAKDEQAVLHPHDLPPVEAAPVEAAIVEGITP